MTSRRLKIFLLLICGGPLLLQGQSTQTISYTTREGLPSNSVYRTVIDQKGFLWIATENGVGRFDGRKFETYTTAKGLTDNEVIELFIDSSNTIWAVPFRRSPCYYNPQKNRFENETTDAELKKIDLLNTHISNVFPYSGIGFVNNKNRFFLFKNGKVTIYNDILEPKLGRLQKIVEMAPGRFVFVCEDSIRYFNNGKITGKTPFGKKILAAEYLNGKTYVVTPSSIVQLSINDVSGSFSTGLTQEYPFEIRLFSFTGKSFAITSINGNTYLADTATLDIKDNIDNKMQVRNVMEDNQNNTWLCTMENGLIKKQQKRILSYTAVPEVQQNFNAIIKTKSIIAGTNNGEVLVYDGLYSVRKTALAGEKSLDAWVRKIVTTSEGVFIATQAGSFLFDPDITHPLRQFSGSYNKSSKTVIKVNDSVLAMGNHAQVMKYNLKANQYTDSIIKRVVSLAAGKNGTIYIGSNDGLYRWDKDSLYGFNRQRAVLGFRVNAMIVSPDGLLWVGLASDSLLVMKDDQLLAALPLGGTIPGNICKSLYCSKTGEVWLGTNKGLNRIRYSTSDKGFSYLNTYFGSADGLIGEQVNDITEANDTIYAATSGGISYLPASLSLPVTDIATFITRISINGQDAELKNSYNLPYRQNDVTVEFSGVDLTGYVPLFEYSTNGGAWKRTDKIELKKLSPGNYNIKIRAIKRDGTPSAQAAAVSISIRTPFWKSSVFWTLFALVSFGSVIYFIQKRNRQRQKTAIEKITTEKKIAELEMQALKAQINPHFVFNCLNSIKGFIYEKDYAQADKYLDKFSELLRSTMDNADASIISLAEEIKYLDTYLQLEKLRFADKFEYSIGIEPGIDTGKTFVPAMLLQPYVENAIRHGVRYLEDKKGLITISLKQDEEAVRCEIDDNGVGRAKAAELKSAMHVEYQSRGMQLSRRRAELYNIKQAVADKHDGKGNATGTTIILIIPVELKP